MAKDSFVCIISTVQMCPEMTWLVPLLKKKNNQLHLKDIVERVCFTHKRPIEGIFLMILKNENNLAIPRMQD